MVSIFGIYTSLLSLCLSSSSSWYAPMGATTLYVVLMLMSCTNIRIYKEEEPPLPARRAGYSVILMVSMFYFTYYYSTIDALIYVCSLFAFGISIFQLNSPMDTKHVFCTFCFGLISALNGYGLGDWLDPERSFGWVVAFAFLSTKLMFPINGIYI